ncbi:hypothetical protein [Dyadobacter sp. OTU695]|uniref:hypothetical protein n=1 Tax=Dyadobacter sp. OTU695 TaxID=3043860 RepID=UPI00313BF254
MKTTDFLKLAGIAVAVILSAVLLILTLMARWEVRKSGQDTFELQTLGKNSRGAFVHRWLLIIVAGLGICIGPSISGYILTLAALISERLIIYRAFRPNDKLGKFLTKLNW